jgi:FkbM family methyltransferase
MDPNSIPLKCRMARLVGRHLPLPRGQDRIVRWLAPPQRMPPIKFEVDFFGRTWAGELNSFIDWSIYMYGAYSLHELLLLQDIALALRTERPRINFYDVGANVGQHTLFMSGIADRVISFEPFAPVRNRIHRNVALNDLSNVTVVPCGLGAFDDYLLFHAPTTENKGVGSFRAVNAEGVPESALRLQVRRGDNVLAEMSLPPIDIMKIDVEGFEAAVLDGLESRLRQDRPILVMEISGSDRSGFGTSEGLAMRLYEDCELYRLDSTSIAGTYRLLPFRFDDCTEVLVVPKEHSSLLSGKLMR